MTSLFVEPNYDPESIYCQIEGFLLFCDNVFVYGPNATAMDRAARSLRESGKEHLADVVSFGRFGRLASKGYITPIASPQYWDRESRTERSSEIARKGDSKRSEFFWWTDFDEEMAAIGRPMIGFRRSGEWARGLAERDPIEFDRMVREISELRRTHKLPQQFFGSEYTNQSDAAISSELLYNLGCDIGLLRDIGADTYLLSQDLQPLHGLYAKIAPNSPYARHNVLPQANEQIELSSDDFKIAAEFGKRLASGYEIFDIIDEYRSSNFSHCFRSFVKLAIPALLNEGNSKESLADGLVSLFNKAADDIKGFSRSAGGLATTAATWASFEALARNPISKEFMDQTFGRRLFLGSLGRIALGAFLGYELPLPLNKMYTAATSPCDEWVALVALKARRRAI